MEAVQWISTLIQFAKSNSDLTLIHDINTPIKNLWNIGWVLFQSEGSVWLIRMLFKETTKAD